MKKEQTKQDKKLTLGKKTMAILRQSQMQLMNGGNATKPTVTNPITGNGGQSFVDEPNNPCVLTSFGSGING
jgi:hypothetical protein